MGKCTCTFTASAMDKFKTIIEEVILRIPQIFISFLRESLLPGLLKYVAVDGFQLK